jgi:hypothetical protein
MKYKKLFLFVLLSVFFFGGAFIGDADAAITLTNSSVSDQIDEATASTVHNVHVNFHGYSEDIATFNFSLTATNVTIDNVIETGGESCYSCGGITFTPGGTSFSVNCAISANIPPGCPTSGGHETGVNFDVTLNTSGASTPRTGYYTITVPGDSETANFNVGRLNSFTVSSGGSFEQGVNISHSISDLRSYKNNTFPAEFFSASEDVQITLNGVSRTVGIDLSGSNPSATLTVGPGQQFNIDTAITAGSYTLGTVIKSITQNRTVTITRVFDHFIINPVTINQGGTLTPQVRAIDKAGNLHTAYDDTKNFTFEVSDIGRKGAIANYGDVNTPNAVFSGGIYTGPDLLQAHGHEAVAGTYNNIDVRVDGSPADDFDFNVTVNPVLSGITAGNKTINQGDVLNVSLTGEDMVGDAFVGTVDLDFKLSAINGIDEDVTDLSVTFIAGAANPEVLGADGTEISANTYSNIEVEYNISVKDTFNLTVNQTLGSIEISPADTQTIYSTGTQTYTVEAFDLVDATMGDKTADAAFSIDDGAQGEWGKGELPDNVYTSLKSGTWTVEASYGGKTDTVTLIVKTGEANEFTVTVEDITAGVEAAIAISIAKDQDENLLDGDYKAKIEILKGGTVVHTYDNQDITFDLGTLTPEYETGIITVAGENYSIKVTIDGTERSDTFNIQPAVADHFKVTGGATATAGVEHTVTITAYDTHNNVLSFGENIYQGAKTITFSGPLLSLDGVTPTVNGTNIGLGTSLTFTSGTVNATHIPYKAEVFSLGASDGSINANDNKLSLTVKHNAPASLRLTGVGTLVAGASHTITVTAHDAYGNVADGANGASGYNGSKTLTFSGPEISPDGDDMPTVNTIDIGDETTFGFTSGTADVTLLAYKAQVVDLNVDDESIDSSGDGHKIALTVKHSIPSSLRITGDATMSANDTNAMTITAYDAYGNLLNGANEATPYTGNKTLVFSGPGVSPGGNVPTVSGINVGSNTTVSFTEGVATPVNLVPFKAERIDVNVSEVDGITSLGKEAYALDLITKHLVADAFRVEILPEEPVTGELVDLTVTAIDIYGNTADGVNEATVYQSPQLVGFDTNATGPTWHTNSVFFNPTDKGVRTISGAVVFNNPEVGKKVFADDRNGIYGELDDIDISGDLVSPPVISSQWPAVGVSNVSVSATPYVVFNRAMNSATITPTTVKLYKVEGGQVSVDDISLTGGGKRANIFTTELLEYETEYYIVVTTDVKDLFNNSLVEQYGGIETSNFTTADTPVVEEPDAVTVDRIQRTKTYATADGGYENGWEWIFHITAPTNETELAMRFKDWTSGNNTIAAANNIRYMSDEAVNTDWVEVTVAEDFSETLITLNDDLSSASGRQFKVIVQARIPEGSAGGSYSTSYDVRTEVIE